VRGEAAANGSSQSEASRLAGPTKGSDIRSGPDQRSLNDRPILGRVSTPARLNLFATVLASMTGPLSDTRERRAGPIQRPSLRRRSIVPLRRPSLDAGSIEMCGDRCAMQTEAVSKLVQCRTLLVGGHQVVELNVRQAPLDRDRKPSRLG